MRGLSTGARAGTALAAAVVLVAGVTTSTAATASDLPQTNGPTLPGAFGSLPPSNGTPTNGGVVTIAESPGAGPTYIMPIFPAADASVGTNQQFQQYMYRALWWSPKGVSPTIDYKQSMAGYPVFSNANKTVTVHLYPGWKWSDGQPITSQDLAFYYWILEAAVNKTVGGSPANYGDYTPGLFPDNVTSISTPNASTLIINFDKTYNQNFVFLQELGAVTPMPSHAWARTSAGGPIVAFNNLKSAAAIYKFLNAQSNELHTWGSNPLWQVVDGPYHLTSYQPNTEVTIGVNTKYSGPVKPKLSSIKFLNFTSDSAEYLALLSGSLDYGYVPFADAKGDARVKSLGYAIDPWSQGGMNYAEYNYTNPAVGSMFKQFYVREAIQSLVDQPAYIKAALYGYGVPTYGPVPAFTPSVSFNGVPEADPAQQKNLYPFSVAKAKSLLSANGWSVVPGGVDTCAKPGTAKGDCGAGVTKGEKLSFQILYPSGVIQYGVELQALASTASEAGVQMTLHQNSDSQVFALTALCKKGAACPWQVGYPFLGGWQYGLPLNYPVPSVVFGCGGFYVGGYCSATANQLMAKAEVSQSVKALYPLEDYLAKDLPVIWLPLQPYSLSAISSRLQGVDPQNTQGLITPEFWSVK